MPFQIQVDATTIPALIFGGLVVLAAVAMAVLVRRTRRLQEPMLENDDVARQHADRQFRRRMQVSIMLAAES